MSLLRVIIKVETMAWLSWIVMIIGITYVTAINHYVDRYDNIDFKALLANDNVREEWVNCFLEKGPCVTEEERFFKDIIYEALLTQCAKCSKVQKSYYSYSKAWFMKNAPDTWKALIAKSLEKQKETPGLYISKYL